MSSTSDPGSGTCPVRGSCTIVDLAIMRVTRSTKNAEERRDPEMHRMRKGPRWLFGRQQHIGSAGAPRIIVLDGHRWRMGEIDGLFSGALDGCPWFWPLPGLNSAA